MFLGLDFSTQQLKAIILACPSGTVLVEEHVSFDVDLPNFK